MSLIVGGDKAGGSSFSENPIKEVIITQRGRQKRKKVPKWLKLMVNSF